MTTVKDIYNYIDKIAPFKDQEDYDNSGINIIVCFLQSLLAIAHTGTGELAKLLNISNCYCHNY